MPGHINSLREEAGKNPKRIILPEGSEPRILKAAEAIASKGIASVMLFGKKNEIKKKAESVSVNLDKIKIIDPEGYARLEEAANVFYNLRKHKGVSPEEAHRYILENTVSFAALMVRLGEADGFVAGASHTTSDVARAALFCIGLDREIGVMSSSFVVELENYPYGDNGLFVFGDCGIVPDPNPMRLAGIAISCSRLYEELFKRKPRVALLSYSTKASAKGPSIEKVRKALQIIKQKAPDLCVDGELQLDAAIVPGVAEVKAPDSVLGGQANVLIFPNLDAGNIAYKMVQRLARARVLGPLLQGIKKPCSDLSRGCLVEEIIDTVAATVVRAQKC